MANSSTSSTFLSEIKTFEIDIDRIAGLNATIRRPREITCFSYDEQHHFRWDNSSLRYYFPPILPADLSNGFDEFQQLDDSQDEHLDGLLKAITAFEKERGSILKTDIITWRGMMTKIMTAPYADLDEWEMNATCFQGTIFVEENHEKKMASKAAQQARQPNARQHRNGGMSQELMSFWGYKFESLCLLNAPWQQVSREEIENRPELPVSNMAQYCSIVGTGFGKTKLIIGGEVDGVFDCRPEDKSQPVNWVELKTSSVIYHDQDLKSYERKLMKFWAQSFLLGVPKIIVGFRSRQGMLEKLEEIETQRIPDLVQHSGRGLWHGQTCIDFTSAFLEFLRETITEGGVWRIRKLTKRPTIDVYKVEDEGSGSILSEEFVSWRTNLL